MGLGTDRTSSVDQLVEWFILPQRTFLLVDDGGLFPSPTVSEPEEGRVLRGVKRGWWVRSGTCPRSRTSTKKDDKDLTKGKTIRINPQSSKERT